MEFSDTEVIKRTARRLGVNVPMVKDFIDAYAEEWLRHAREVEVAVAKAAKPAPPDGTPPPPSEAPRVTHDEEDAGELVEAMKAEGAEAEATGHPS